MSWKIDGESILIDGWGKGIADSPYLGHADMRNVDITSIAGEVSTAFKAGAVTLPPILNNVAFTSQSAGDTITLASTAGLYNGCAVRLVTSSSTGLKPDSAVNQSISFIIVGGGGAGGNAKDNVSNGDSAGGGGGGGEVVTGTGSIGLGIIAITVGTGGTVGAGVNNGVNGESTIVGVLGTALGGAGGGSAGGNSVFSNTGTNSLGSDAGAGGGGATHEAPGAKNGGTGTFAGGNALNFSGSAGGGGSSSAQVGANVVAPPAFVGITGGKGGNGLAVSLEAISGIFGGGGGGGAANNSTSLMAVAAGGTGGGGNGGRNNNGNNIVQPTAGASNTGGGGGGGGTESGSNMNAGVGGSGVAIIQYLTGTMTATGGVVTISGDYTIHTFTTSGNFEVTSVTYQSLYYVRNLTATTFQVSEYPASPIVDITSNGSGTLTTYQYGNQRSLTANGAPVSYHHVPELEGVLMADSSNYVWFWQQGTTGASAFNTVLFLGNTGGIASTTINETGLVYWNEHVTLVQQPNVLNFLNFRNYMGIGGAKWNYSSIRGSEPLPIFFNTSSPITAVTAYQTYRAVNGFVTPQVVSSHQSFSVTTSTTVTSIPFTVQTGDIVCSVIAAFSNENISGATFNGNAMTLLGVTGSSNTFLKTVRLFNYVVPSDMTGTVVGTYSVTSVNRNISTYVIRNGVALASAVVEQVAASNFGPTNLTRNAPNSIGVLFYLTNNTSPTIISNVNSLEQLLSQTNIAIGQTGTLIYRLTNQGQSTLRRQVPITVGEDDAVYFGSGQNIVGSLIENAGTAFAPNTPETYTFNWNALDLPADEVVQSLEMASSLLYVGATSNKVYPWDTISPSFDYPIMLPESGIVDFVASNNLLYTFGGSLGKTYKTNSSSAAVYRELPYQLTDSEKPYFFFWDAKLDGGELFFTFQSYTNGSITPETNGGGVWAFNADSDALRMVQRPIEGYDSFVRMVCPVSTGNSLAMVQPRGQGLLVGYSRGANYYLDYSVATPYDNWESYVETDIIPVATYFAKYTFQNIEYKLGAPMVAGEGIRISQRSNLSSTYTLVNEFTTPGLISESCTINWENVEWVQFKIEFKSVAASPSYVRLKEIRLR